jgi:O-antigen polymerase
MSGGGLRQTFWPAVFWLALLAGICVAWSPRYWAVSVAITTLGAVAVGWSVFSAIEGRGGVASFRPPWQMALAVAIGVWGFVQIALKITVVPQLTMYSALVWAMSAIAFWLGAEILRERAARALFLQLAMWSITALAVIAMVQYFEHAEVFGIFQAPDSVMGTFISRNQFTAMLELAGPIALWYMLERNFWVGGVCYVMIAAAALAAASRAGFTLMCAELAVFIVIVVTQRRREARVMALTFAGVALLAGVAASIGGTEELRRRFELSDPYAVRRELLASTEKMIAERPWTGFGMGTWTTVYPHTATFDAALLANEAHNDWAQWAAEGGIGFALLMGILVLSLAGPAIQSVWGLGLLSVMAHSYVDFPIREPILSFVWFALAGAAASYVRGKHVRSKPGRRTERREPERDSESVRSTATETHP